MAHMAAPLAELCPVPTDADQVAMWKRLHGGYASEARGPRFAIGDDLVTLLGGLHAYRVDPARWPRLNDQAREEHAEYVDLYLEVASRAADAGAGIVESGEVSSAIEVACRASHSPCPSSAGAAEPISTPTQWPCIASECPRSAATTPKIPEVA
jgi:hypothetical protein